MIPQLLQRRVADDRVDRESFDGVAEGVAAAASPFRDRQGNKDGETERRATIELSVEGAID